MIKMQNNICITGGEKTMQIKQFEVNHVEQVVALWNRSVATETIYKGFTKESFVKKFLDNPFFDFNGTFVAEEDGKIIGFANAIMKNDGKPASETPGYVTCVAVDKQHQRQGIGSELLKALEAYLKAAGKTIIRLLFFNPINLEWIVPGTKDHDHPNAPAVPFNSPFYFLLMANGYIIGGQQQDSYHLNIVNYELPKKVVDKNAENAKDGYTIEIYDEKKHHGFKELFEALNNPGWHEATMSNLAKEKPDPMLVVQKDGEILGWTGPLFTQESGRGYFAGIGVHPNTQGRGLGKSLFCELVYQSKLNGAKFMTLFTGSENPARNIYLYAGFKIVQSFAILRKDLK